MRDEIYMLWLSSLYGMGSRKQNELLDYFGGAREIFNAPEPLLRSAGATANNVQLIEENRTLEKAEDVLRQMEANRMVYVSRNSGSYPDRLKNIPDAPVGLFYIGELPGGEPAAAIIGSRRCSEYGLTAARMLSKPLAANGVIIVSGMARGTDSMAHKGAIEGGGKTIAVLGCGADICYPKENKTLRDEIIKNGCVVSEYPPGVGPLPQHFPARNRIISGLSSVVVVVEAAKKSGTFITVEQAAEQGREVMAVPGSIVSRLSEGTNILIRDGAAVASDYKDVLYALGISPKSAENPPRAVLNSLARDEKIVYDSLTFEPTAFDELALRAVAGGSGDLHYILTMLELKGFIKKLPGLRYVKNI